MHWGLGLNKNREKEEQGEVNVSIHPCFYLWTRVTGCTMICHHALPTVTDRTLKL